MTWPDAGPKLAAAVVAGTLSVLLLTGARARPGRLLGVFLAFIAANQAAESLRALVAGPVAQVFWFKVASVAAALDPAVLLWCWHSERGTRASAAALALGGAVSALTALWAGWLLDAPPANAPSTHIFPLLLGVYTLAAYGYVMVAACLTPGTPATLTAAYAVAAIPVLPRVVIDSTYFLPGLDFETLMLVGVWLPFVLAGAACLALLASRVPGARLGAAAAMGLVAFQQVRTVDGWFAPRGLLPDVEALELLGHVSAAVRWLFFGALASIAVFSASGAGMSLAARRRAARVLLGVAFTLGGASVLLALEWLVPGVPLGVGETLVLLVAVALSQSFRRLVDRTATRVYGVPAAGDVAAAHDTYRRAAAQALAHGRSPSRDAALQRLREELGIDAPTASTLERAAEQLLVGPLVPGQLLMGRYLVEEMLGRGGAGRAFLARDTLLDRTVVVKEVPQEGADEELAVEEARIAGSLDHPHIVTVHDVVRRGAYDCIVTEHVAGGTLAERLARPMPEEDARRILRELLSALATMHERGVLHRDVKPENVLLARDGRAKLADFGLARRRADATVGTSLTPHFAGTPAYLAPEVRVGGAPTAAADVFAVGVLCARLFPEGAPADLAPVVAKARAPDPAQRWQDAGEMLRALQDARQ